MKYSKSITNSELADLFRSVSAVLSLDPKDNHFRIMAYDRAADAVEHASLEIKDLWDDHNLDSIPGVGEGIAGYLDELFKTGKIRHFDNLLKTYPPAMFELIRIPGIGPKNAFKLCKALGLSKPGSAIKKLQKAAEKGQIAKIEGFGDDSQASILKGIAEYSNRSHRLLLSDAEISAQKIIDWLKKIPQVQEAYPLGSIRRQVATVGDIDIAVSSQDPETVIKHFTNFPFKRRVLESGEHSASIILPNDHQVDLIVQPPDSFGSLLQHFTGSKHHNIALRELAIKKGYSLSEYGIRNKDKLIKFSSEEKFYNFLGLDFIPPELRENSREIFLAAKHLLPQLVQPEDIRGDLHIHSDFNIETSHDLGTSSLSEITAKAKSLGYHYIGLSEHNPGRTNHSLAQTLELIKVKTNIVQNYNEKNREKNVYVFNGLEIDIQPDGKRSVSDACLELLDYASVSIHSSFSQSRKIMTDRVIAGLDHPKVRFFAHPTARLLLEREGIELDWDRLFDFCLTNTKWLEINAWPNRLDLPDTLVNQAVSSGIKLIINTDSHNADSLSLMKYGVSVARRGWATAKDIINTIPLTQMRQLIERW